MQTKEITFAKFLELVEEVNNYIVSLPKKIRTPLSVKIEKITPSLKECRDEYNSLVADIMDDHCSLDGNSNMIINEGKQGEDRYTFTPAKRKEMRTKIKELGKQKVTIDVKITSTVPKDITYMMSRAFRGILIPEDYKYIELDEEKIENEEALAQ
jgi:phage-related protein